MADTRFLPGVPATLVMQRLALAGGNEVGSGKLDSPESSAALAVNCFGWFMERPADLPAFFGLEAAFPAVDVTVEYQARFPWAGGRHPWLDAAVITATHLIGIESKRYEPFRDTKHVALSDAYDRNVWGDQMGPYEQMRDSLRAGSDPFRFLDAAQLVKHAFGLVTEAKRLGKKPALVYLYAEPSSLNGTAIPIKSLQRHRLEIQRFTVAAQEAEVSFHSTSYRGWLNTWNSADEPVQAHRDALLAAFDV